MKTQRRDGWTDVATGVLAFGAGFVVFILLAPMSGIDTDPPQCFSAYDYDVPCGAGLSLAAGAATAAALGLLAWGWRRRHRREPPVRP